MVAPLPLALCPQSPSLSLHLCPQSLRLSLYLGRPRTRRMRWFQSCRPSRRSWKPAWLPWRAAWTPWGPPCRPCLLSSHKPYALCHRPGLGLGTWPQPPRSQEATGCPPWGQTAGDGLLVTRLLNLGHHVATASSSTFWTAGPLQLQGWVELSREDWTHSPEAGPWDQAPWLPQAPGGQGLTAGPHISK